MKKIAVLILSLLLASPAFAGVAAQSGNNIVLHKEYTLTSGVPIGGSYENHPENVKDDSFRLTDGKTAGSSESSGNWCKWLRGVSRVVSFDLGGLFTLEGFEASFLQCVTSGIYVPRYVDIYASSDGENYFLWASPEMPFPMSDRGTKRGTYSVSDTRKMTARYVKIVICADINVFCDEIELYGSPAVSENPVKGEEYPSGTKGFFPKYTDATAGFGDMIKIYNGRYAESGTDDTAMGDNTAQELLPYVAYIDADGNIADTLFDAVAFVPIHSDYPSGGRLTLTNNKKGAVMSDWLLYLDNTFKTGVNLDALDEAVGTVYSALGKTGKYTVFLTVPYPTVLSGAFGDIDGDGTAENCVTLEERSAIIEWYINECEKRFAEKNYDNIELRGFYWYREEINESTTDHERELVTSASELIHSRGYSFVFDPFYLSCGFDCFEELGFDCALMQPNLCFYDYFNDSVLRDFAVAASTYGTGCEMEVIEPYNLLRDAKKHGLVFEKYLYNAWKYGYISSAHSYYQGAGPGSFYTMCKSSDAYLRSLYDKLYSFIKGTYTYDEPSAENQSFEGEAGSTLRGSIELTGGSSPYVEVTTQPLHGKVVINGKKSFVYVPDEGFSGTDTFGVTPYDDIAEGKEVTLTLTLSAAPVSTGESVQSEPEPIEKNKSMTYVIAAAAAVSVAVVSAIIIRKRKRKKQ